MSVATAGDTARLRDATDLALGALLSLPAPLVPRLRACARTAAGLEAAGLARLGTPAATGAVQGRVLGLDRAGVARLALCAGAVWHARAVLRLLDGAALRAFVAEAGEAPRAAALRWHAMAGGADTDGPLGAAVARDGWRCLRAWCEAQPAAVSRRVALCMPDGVAAPGGDAAACVRIVEALAGDADA